MGLKLGSWRTTARLADVRMEPQREVDATRTAEATAALRAKIEESFSKDECLWNSSAELFIPGLRLENDCEFSRVEARDGRFGVSGICDRLDPPVRIEMAVDGTYNSKTVNSRTRSVATMQGVRIEMILDMESRFLGKCDAVPVVMKPSPQGD